MQRRKLLGLMSLLMLPRQVLAKQSKLTPSQTEGPFYPVESIPERASLIVDENVVRGELIDLHGRVLDDQGGPRVGARIEIWQCDGNGVYTHPRQPGTENFDPGFAGFGAQLTDSDGQYRFTTIFPAPYPGRPPHIHVKIWDGDRTLLTTQLYPQETKEAGRAKSPQALRTYLERKIDGNAETEFTFIT